MPEGTIINPDYYWENEVDPELLINPLTQGEWTTKIEEPFFEIAGLSYYSLGWACKYILNTELAAYQTAFLYMLWTKKYPLLLASRGASKTFTLAVYATLRALFDQGSKVVIVSATFRQAKHIFTEIENIYKRAPLLRACVREKPRKSVDHCIFKVGDSTITALPMGNGDGIRGQRASHIIVDEVDSVDPETMHVVVRGFAATQLNPMAKIKEAARRKREGLKKVRKVGEGNQIVIAGTAGFTGGNFHKLYQQYETIVASEAIGYGYEVADKLGQDLGDMWVDYRDYGMIALPWFFVPEGMLDRDMISNAKMTMSTMLFNMEYNCIFADTSHGFFKHQDIMRATSSGQNGFVVKPNGTLGREYVMGVDPARTSDAFGIVIVELGNPRKVVYCYTSINEPFTKNARHMLELMEKFNIVRVGMDLGGGGLAVEDFLQDPQMLDGRSPIYRFDEDNKSRPGKYILNMINFETRWIEDANFQLQKNIEDREILFPSQTLSGKKYKGENIDVMEEIHNEIEACKKELAQISVTQTITGKRHFDIQPSLEDKKRKIKPRKDRYSALLIANFIAHEMADYKNPQKDSYRNWADPGAYGGWSEDFSRI